MNVCFLLDVLNRITQRDVSVVQLTHIDINAEDKIIETQRNSAAPPEYILQNYHKVASLLSENSFDNKLDCIHLHEARIYCTLVVLDSNQR